MKNLRLIWINFVHSLAFRLLVGSYLVAIIGGLGISWWEVVKVQKGLVAEIGSRETIIQTLDSKLEAKLAELKALQNDDQVVKNASLSAEIDSMQKTYEIAQQLFEDRSDLVIVGEKTNTVDLALAKFLGLLGEKKWSEANEQRTKVRAEIDKIIAASIPKVTTSTATSSNTAPSSGYSKQKVSTSRGEFVISLIVAPGSRAVVETAGDSDCTDNCPTKSLAEHIAASGGFAGINGAYFCPADYPRCQGKVNSFDTLAVNGRTKVVLNQANNVYSTIPLVAMYGSSLSFYDQTVQWGVDIGSNGALANFPRLLRDGSVVTSDDGSKGTRGFIGTKDGAIVIGHVFAASMADTAEVLKTLGLQNALNLDGGGSSALWIDGSYKVGPGRSLPTAIVLVR
ncbi:MAG: hypothetical protein Fur0011_4980 [Candidatus Microgenomates bacterium]